MDVSEYSGTPKSILIGFSIINHPFWDTPIFENTQMDTRQDWIPNISSALSDILKSAHSRFIKSWSATVVLQDPLNLLVSEMFGDACFVEGKQENIGVLVLHRELYLQPFGLQTKLLQVKLWPQKEKFEFLT